MSTKKIVVLIGAIAVVVSVFLPFFTAGAMGINISFSTFDLLNMGAQFGFGGMPIEFYLYLGGAVLSLIALILVLIGKAGIFPLISGLVCLIAGAWTGISLSSQLGEAMGLTGAAGLGVSAGMGLGFWVYLVGAVLQIAGSFLKEQQI